MPAKDPTRWTINSTFLLLIVEFILMGGQCGTAYLFLLFWVGARRMKIKGEDSMAFWHIGSAPTSIRVRFALRVA
jgi:hypothetical protein